MLGSRTIRRRPLGNALLLAGITRRRVIQLLRDAGKEVRERSITYEELA